MNPQVKHLLLVVGAAALGGIVEAFTPGAGAWSHAFWAPVVVALAANLQTALKGKS